MSWFAALKTRPGITISSFYARANIQLFCKKKEVSSLF